MRRLVIFAASALAVFCSARVGLVETVEPVNPFEGGRVAAVKTQPPKKGDIVGYSADVWKSAWGQRKTHLFKGNVRFTHGDTVLTSDQVEYDEDAGIAVSPGKVTIADPECDITGSKGTAFFKKKLGVIEGSVVMLVKPQRTEQESADKESVRSRFTQPTTITCPKVEYLYGKKIATATGGVSFKQDKRTAYADKAVYDEKKELLVLTGNIRGTDEEGQEFRSLTKVTISLKRGDEWMEAEKASATFRIDLEEEEGEQ